MAWYDIWRSIDRIRVKSGVEPDVAAKVHIRAEAANDDNPDNIVLRLDDEALAGLNGVLPDEPPEQGTKTSEITYDETWERDDA